ncbi:tRNA threonylcarbamoyladenosine dehydratase [Tissierella sp. MB52-C2]|uniref:tRNA threonylcarbamoyladenosine dehydratase n=1 Tax=Tissierella sp. MB52-C2 TaxID=3070999 RepID=UPI00280A7DBE|nr:tRNA threonylcarbamoyladenosine dehydratase [Tissierella sp. MB52-C2]WMM25022.1 tRNA threonylcarbamoyladenosine dehydratase [Tissierella sp. MB52-C2]
MNEFSRTELLLGAEGVDKLRNSFVAVFGVGGVGSFTVEALVRSGVGNIAIIDDDKVCLTNINRQLIATRKTVGKNKVEVMRDRILEINPKVNVEIHQTFYTKDNADEFDLSKYTYVVDAIDTVSSKLTLIERAKSCNTPIISSMGAGNKLDPTKFQVTDIYKTSICPLARAMRSELRKRGIESLKVVYSQEPALKPIENEEDNCSNKCICPSGTQRKCTVRRQIPGSVAFVPSVAGLIIAGEVIKDIIEF